MRILAIETTGPICSVALLNEENRITELRGRERMNHLRSLTPMIDQLLQAENMAPEDLDQIAVSVGPGSFTGIRIGVSTARAMAQMTGVRLTAVPTLYAFGYGACPQEDPALVVCPMLDARRQQVYAGAYRDGEEIVAGKPYPLDAFLDQLTDMKRIRFMGDGLARYGESVRDWARTHGVEAALDEETQSAGYVAELARDMMDAPDFADMINLDYNQLQPNYMRKAEAQRRLEEKQKQGQKR
ncbi:MAG: tRNA (adenosine(37)-N6)-threonylcarbamoyltransferase complex dimerization subunit type 1 TsaB [Eubacteriales bacterium]|nr:tRNA (adenosine(37)-N6)-threonylcarbamoyltransferase complex dimerization subunit type 1 TsaB [Eubacteriales bacterium]